MTENGGSTTRVANRYRLERRIGRGGAGAVWRAHDELLDRKVAVKQIAIAADTEARSRGRALREARAVARLHVPNVVQIYDVIEEGDSVYLIMELVEAPDLNALVRRNGALTPRDAAALGLQMLDALEAAHGAGVVHRDVKPSNVLIDRDSARLTDFGIAHLSDDPTLTWTGVMGTPAYIAPEHAQDFEIGPAVDLYGLGATLYYAVEGRPPYDAGGSLSTVLAVINSPPRPPTKAGPLTGLLNALLAKDPKARPSPEDVRRQLEDVAEQPGPKLTDPKKAPWVGGVAGAQPVTPAPRREPPRSNRRRIAMLASVIGLLVVAALGLNSMFGDRQQSASDDASPPAAGAQPPTEAPTDADDENEAAGTAPTPEASPTPSPEPPEPSGNDEADDGDEGDEGDGVLPATDADVPEDWVEFAPDHAPYRLRHPPDWEIERVAETLTDIRDPQTGTYLRLDWVNERRDPVGAWEQFEPTFASRHSGYERIGITPTTFNGDPAALWEYRYTSGGAQLHAYNLGVNQDDHGFALNLQAREDNWEQAQELWPLFLSSYQFTG